MKKYFTLCLYLFLGSFGLFAQEDKIYNDLKTAAKSPDKVYKLELIGKGLLAFPSEALQFKNLRSLNLSHNQIEAVPAEIGQLTNLRSLVLEYNKLGSVPPQIGNLTNLEQLSLHNNRLRTLPTEIGNLSNLKILSLFGNQFTTYPTEIDKLYNLNSLNLTGNRLGNLSSEIGNFKSLQTLHISYNELKSLPPSIGKLTNLETFTMERNKITDLPKEMANMQKLTTLNLRDNPFKNIPEELYTFLQQRSYGESEEVKYLIVQLSEEMKRRQLQTEEEKKRAELQTKLSEEEREKERIKANAAIAAKERERESAALKAKIAEEEAIKKDLEARILNAKSQAEKDKLLKEKEENEKRIQTLNEKQRLQEMANKALAEKAKVEQEKAEKEAWLNQVIIYSVIGAFLLLLLIALLIYRNAQRQKKANVVIAGEKAKSEALLLNILPHDVAEELKEKGITTVHYFEHTSVLFADVKGFSAMAAKVKPQELIKELDTCFGKYDEITTKYGLERIKTIGDCYMCTGGVPHRTRTHALDITLAAMEIQRWMEDERKRREAQGGTYWQARLGIHTGDLVAGVIGKTKFAYDVWGNTVNTASRMESGGEVGKVNITEATYNEIKDFFVFESRGKIEAKNIGWVETFFVLGIKPELSLNGKGLEPNEAFWELKKAKFGEEKVVA